MYFNPISIIVSVVGLYLMLRLRFFFILHPIRTIKKIMGALKDRTAFRSLTLALAGTLGVGNIFGVCTNYRTRNNAIALCWHSNIVGVSYQE